MHKFAVPTEDRLHKQLDRQATAVLTPVLLLVAHRVAFIRCLRERLRLGFAPLRWSEIGRPVQLLGLKLLATVAGEIGEGLVEEDETTIGRPHAKRHIGLLDDVGQKAGALLAVAQRLLGRGALERKSDVLCKAFVEAQQLRPKAPFAAVV